MQTSIRPRLFESDLEEANYSISFNGKDHMTHLQITGYGDPLVKAMDCVSMITKHKPGPAGDHFRKLVKRNKILEHNDRQLQDNIKV